LAPDQSSSAVQLVVSVVVQDSIDVPPAGTDEGFAVKVIAGAGMSAAASETVTVVEAVLVPPGPVQVREYVVVTFRGPVDWEPFAPTEPDQAPDALHDVALLVDQESVLDAPRPIATGLAASVILGLEFGVVDGDGAHAAIANDAAENTTRSTPFLKRNEPAMESNCFQHYRSLRHASPEWNERCRTHRLVSVTDFI